MINDPPFEKKLYSLNKININLYILNWLGRNKNNN